MSNSGIRWLGMIIIGIATLLGGCRVFVFQNQESTEWKAIAKRVTITRDDWGVPHIQGKSDADAVFGMIYAQAEDDFNRIEMNYLNALGRYAEAADESEIYRDLRMRFITNEDSLKVLYSTCPPWMHRLMISWAGALNFFLACHPDVHPKVIKRFEPWMVLAFTEGSIGWDIESVSLREVEAFYGVHGIQNHASGNPAELQDPGGSNGIAIAGSLTQSGRPLLLINPHTSFFFRAEAQVQSDEGLNAYGAATWGQFFIYQGFNDRLGWMHTSSGADRLDEYAETILRKPQGLFYLYGNTERPVITETVTIRYKTGTGMAERRFTVFRTHHGPVVRQQDDKWITVRLMHDPVNALFQSYQRTKATDFASFRKLLDLHTNSSNNTVYADADGNIAYFHANFIPRRRPGPDWNQPVDGSDPANEWQGIHPVDESPNVKNPATGWIQNTNNWPYTVSGSGSPKQSDFPSYMDRSGENSRGIHAIRVLSHRKDFTPDSLISAAYDSYLPAFDELLPPLFREYQELSPADELRQQLSEPIALLESWDRRWSLTSAATSLAVYWGQELWRLYGANPLLFRENPQKTTRGMRLRALASAMEKLTVSFGTWKTPWGNINRLQRLNGNIMQQFNDSANSLPVPFTSGQWGSLASFSAKTYPGTRRMYGTSGNSFVAVVEFGPRVKAKAISVGGESSDPKSPHFNDQAERYAQGKLRDVYFYPGDLSRHARRTYHPGK